MSVELDIFEINIHMNNGAIYLDFRFPLRYEIRSTSNMERARARYKISRAKGQIDFFGLKNEDKVRQTTPQIRGQTQTTFWGRA